jgi:hypothetical protein
MSHTKKIDASQGPADGSPRVTDVRPLTIPTVASPMGGEGKSPPNGRGERTADTLFLGHIVELRDNGRIVAIGAGATLAEAEAAAIRGLS